MSGKQLEPRAAGAAASYYVEHQPKDGRHLEREISESLRSRGLAASSGAAADRPADVDFVVTYVDRWQWDMRMYLITLRIDVIDPATGHVVAWGESHQTSLPAMGMTFRDVIDRALAVIFEDGIDRASGRSSSPTVDGGAVPTD